MKCAAIRGLGYPQSRVPYVRSATLATRLPPVIAASIGDLLPLAFPGLDELARQQRQQDDDEGHAVGHEDHRGAIGEAPVSYTHLTLPTILLV